MVDRPSMVGASAPPARARASNRMWPRAQAGTRDSRTHRFTVCSVTVSSRAAAAAQRFVPSRDVHRDVNSRVSALGGCGMVGSVADNGHFVQALKNFGASREGATFFACACPIGAGGARTYAAIGSGASAGPPMRFIYGVIGGSYSVTWHLIGPVYGQVGTILATRVRVL